jgi:hypothetical protein
VLHTGEVYQLPPAELDEDDPKYRPHVLLTDSPEEDSPCTLAYCSRQATEMSFGARACLVDPHRTSYRRTGFTHPTYVYPNRLVSVDAGDLLEPVGKVVDELVEIRDRLRTALGLGTGRGAGRGEAAGSWRGQIVVFQPPYADGLDTPFGLVVTEPRYSREERFQLIVPIHDADEVEEVENDLIVEGHTDELRRLGIPYTRLLLATSFIESVFHSQAFERSSLVFLPDAVMADVDLRLTLLFSI